jgi:ATP-dependent Lon protease
MATSIASALTRVPVRHEVAMTGEITLRGRVMPIGGLKEKLLAANRHRITTVLIPHENRKDLKEVPRRVLKALRIVLVRHMDDVLREALRFPDPDTLFGPHKPLIEYRYGELIDPDETAPKNEPGPPPGDAPPAQPGLSG